MGRPLNNKFFGQVGLGNDKLTLTAWIPGGTGAYTSSVIKQTGTRRYKVSNIDGQGIVYLQADEPTGGGQARTTVTTAANGTGATATATGKVVTATVNAPGSGYAVGDSLVAAAGAGTAAKFSVNYVQAVSATVASTGTGDTLKDYAPNDTLTLSKGTGTLPTFNVDSVRLRTTTAQGTGKDYLVGDTLTFSGMDWSTSGVLTVSAVGTHYEAASATVSTSGTGDYTKDYNPGEILTLKDGTPTKPTFTIDSVSVRTTSPFDGNGYLVGDTLTFSTGFAVPAVLTVATTTTHYEAASATINTTGSGDTTKDYVPGDTLTSDGTGTQPTWNVDSVSIRTLAVASGKNGNGYLVGDTVTYSAAGWATPAVLTVSATTSHYDAASATIDTSGSGDTTKDYVPGDTLTSDGTGTKPTWNVTSVNLRTVGVASGKNGYGYAVNDTFTFGSVGWATPAVLTVATIANHYEATTATVSVSGSGDSTKDYVPGDTLTLNGGTGTYPTFSVTAVNVRTYSVDTGGTNYVIGDTLTFSTGWAVAAVLTVSAVNKGAITAVTITNAGSWTTNPIPTDPVTPDSQVSALGSGAKIKLGFGVKTVSLSTSGDLTATAANPVSTTTDSVKGTGATLTVSYNTIGGVPSALTITNAGSWTTGGTVPTDPVTPSSQTSVGGTGATFNLGFGVKAVSVISAGDLTATKANPVNTTTNSANGTGAKLNVTYNTYAGVPSTITTTNAGVWNTVGSVPTDPVSYNSTTSVAGTGLTINMGFGVNAISLIDAGNLSATKNNPVNTTTNSANGTGAKLNVTYNTFIAPSSYTITNAGSWTTGHVPSDPLTPDSQTSVGGTGAQVRLGFGVKAVSVLDPGNLTATKSNPVDTTTDSPTGTGAKLNVTYNTVSGVPTTYNITTPGSFTNPTIPTDPVTPSSQTTVAGTGATVKLGFGVDTVSVKSSGQLSATSANPVATTTDSAKGTGATLNVSYGIRDTLTISDAGSYTTLPTLTANPVTGGSGAGATVDLSIGVKDVTVVTGGSSYTIAGATFGGGGTGTKSNVTVVGEAVTTVTVTDPGYGYTTRPTVTIYDAGATKYAKTIYGQIVTTWDDKIYDWQIEPATEENQANLDLT